MAEVINPRLEVEQAIGSRIKAARRFGRYVAGAALAVGGPLGLVHSEHFVDNVLPPISIAGGSALFIETKYCKKTCNNVLKNYQKTIGSTDDGRRLRVVTLDKEETIKVDNKVDMQAKEPDSGNLVNDIVTSAAPGVITVGACISITSTSGHAWLQGMSRVASIETGGAILAFGTGILGLHEYLLSRMQSSYTQRLDNMDSGGLFFNVQSRS